MSQTLFKEQSNLQSADDVFAKRVADRAPGMIVVYNINTGRYVYVNDCVEKLLGYKPEDFTSRGLEFVSSLVHPEDIPKIMEKNNQALAEANQPGISDDSDPIVSFEYRMKHKNGSWVWLHTDGIVFDRTSEGKVNHVMNISIDITEHKEAEGLRLANLRLEQSKEELEVIFNSIEDGITVQDRTGQIVYANNAALKFMGFDSLEQLFASSPAAIMDKFEVFDETGNSFDLNNLPGRQALLGKETKEIIVKWLDKNKGESKWSSIRATAINDYKGQPIYAVNIFRDITLSKKILDDLDRTNRRNQHILESITDGFFAFDKDWKFNYVNKQAEPFLTKKYADLIGRTLWDTIPNAKENQAFEKIVQAVRENRPIRFEQYSASQDRLFELSVYPSRDGVSVYLRDITDTDRVERINAQLAAIVRSSEDAIIGKDLNGNITSWNKGAEHIYGYKAEEVIGKNITMLVPEDRPNEIEYILSKIRSGESVEHYETFRKRKDGKQINVHVTISPVKNSKGEIIGASAVARDITELKKAQQSLVESEKRFRALIENSSDGIALLGKDGKIKYMSSSAEKIMGYTMAEMNTHTRLQSVHPDDYEYVSKLYEKVMTGTSAPITAVYRSKRKDGQYRWFEVVATNLFSDPSVNAVVINFRDITERKKAEEQLSYQYHHDALTDLPNRVLFNEELVVALDRTQGTDTLLAIMLLDLDRFKFINESLGHALGDRLIQEVSLRLSSTVGEKCSLARFGGDEFGILLPQIPTEQEAADLAGKILEAFRPPFNLDSHELYITPSIGISVYPYDGKEIASLLKNAEAALYRTKEQGGNSYQFYTNTMNALSYEKLTMESKLRRAIEQHEFVLFYQPQIDIRTGKIIGTEEFIRWQKPDMSLVLPDRFIPLAEANGLIEPIGEWVLYTAIKQLKVWNDMGFDLSMAINISGRQLRQKNFINQVINAIEQYKVNPSRIELEITESMVIQNSENALSIMKQLNEMGVKFALDDFSTGYTSLKYLKEYPVDAIKIERQFMRDVPFDSQNSAIVKSIVTLGHSLGMKIVAEGVESKNQLGFLSELGCEIAQGFLFNGAMPPHSLNEVLDDDRYVGVVSKIKK
jgi:PAS domain S-box-containing protein/diguanylate cyclase (GGDEF)-like protein